MSTKKTDIVAEEQKVDVSAAEQAPPATVYEVVMASMTPQKLANLGVKLASVNNRELYWVTSVGQLYEFNAYDTAVQAEYNWLMSDPN